MSDHEPTSNAECGCPTYHIEDGLVEVIHYDYCEYHVASSCQICQEALHEEKP